MADENRLRISLIRFLSHVPESKNWETHIDVSDLLKLVEECGNCVSCLNTDLIRLLYLEESIGMMKTSILDGMWAEPHVRTDRIAVAR